MNILLELPRFSDKPLGMQMYIENVVKSLLDNAEDEFQFWGRVLGIRYLKTHFEQVRSIDTGARLKSQCIPIPDFVHKRIFKSPIWDSSFNKPFDLIHNLSGRRTWSERARTVITIQDVIPLRLDEDSAAFKATVLETWKQIVPRADKIITISEFSKREIVDLLEVVPSKVSVIYNGVDHHKFKPISESDRPLANDALRIIGITKPYALQLGGTVPRKNLPRLIDAFEIFRRESGCEHQLVLAGSGVLPQLLAEKIANCPYKDDIIMCGYLGSQQALWLLQNALMLVFPSTYEGFGMPPLEAMACGVPVAMSNAASLPEVGGNAPLYFDPLEPTAIADQMISLLRDEVRKDCISKGLQQSALFSWRQNALDTLGLYREVLGAKSRTVRTERSS